VLIPLNLNILAPRSPPLGSRSEQWIIFCAVIDNYGDMGVCWRMARQLQSEHGVSVTLFVDDFDALMDFLAHDPRGKSMTTIAGIDCGSWQAGPEFEERALHLVSKTDVLIEAFACELPELVLHAMAQRSIPPVWINLEYLSAESWVIDCHGLSSMLAVTLPSGESKALNKTFFFPGFTAGTGGLLREREIVARHLAWQGEQAASRKQFLDDFAYGLSEDSVLAPWVSIFSYETSALPQLLASMSEDAYPVVCLVPMGRSIRNVQEFLGADQVIVPGVYTKGALSLYVLPFLSQDDFDRLLSLCDFNIVRGEDSFVRAQWAGRAFLWHIYPQDEGAHMVKLEAFLARYDAHVASEPCESQRVLAGLWQNWNLGEDCSEMWHHLQPQLSRLEMQAGQWRQAMMQLPDFSANLLNFCRQQ
jgi:uncharacterized repeat protein (TIGR03837 family)